MDQLTPQSPSGLIVKSTEKQELGLGEKGRGRTTIALWVDCGFHRVEQDSTTEWGRPRFDRPVVKSVNPAVVPLSTSTICAKSPFSKDNLMGEKTGEEVNNQYTEVMKI